MATVPLSATDIHFLKGVPFNSDYKNTRWFDTVGQKQAYFNGRTKVHSMTQATFQRIEGRNYVKVNLNTDDLWATNYMYFTNRGRRFYAFVTNLEYKNDGMTHVHFAIDVFQTWIHDVNVKPSYIVREHQKLFESPGNPVINTIDEGLDYGDEYETVEVTQWTPHDDLLFLVIAMKEDKSGSLDEGDDESGTDITPTYNAVPQPLSYFVHPFTKAMTTPTITVGGKATTLSKNILDVIEGLSSQEGTVNNVVSSYVTDSIGLNFDYNSSAKTINFPSSTFELVSFSDNVNTNFNTVKLKRALKYVTKSLNMGDKYKNYHMPTESKLLMYPYTVLVLEDFKGNRVELKNEHIKSTSLEVTCQGSMGSSNKVAYSIADYENRNVAKTERDKLSLEHALINSDPQDIPSIDDMLSAYMQGNRNSLKTEKNKAVFSGVTSMLGGAAMGGANISHVSSARRIPSPVGLAMSAKDVVTGAGNMALELQAINSKIKDIDNTPASLNSMGGNINFDVGNGLTGVHIIKKQVRPEYRARLEDFFNLFGYKINRVKIPNFHTRRNWNYVETKGVTITGDLNNNDLQELKNVFDNGITLWHTNDIGNYALDNGVL